MKILESRSFGPPGVRPPPHLKAGCAAPELGPTAVRSRLMTDRLMTGEGATWRS